MEPVRSAPTTLVDAAHNPAGMRATVAALAEARRDGAAILLVEQNVGVAHQLGDTVAVMDGGRVIHRGTMAELAADAALQQRLLGLSLEAHA